MPSRPWPGPEPEEMSPMTVRWRPLIVLSGLFLVLAIAGLLTVTLDLVPAQAEDILPSARQEWKAGRFSNAQIHFQRALQIDPKNAEIHNELARMYAEWADQESDPGAEARLSAERLSALASAARYGKDPAPRRELLADALAHENPVQAELWAKKLLDLDSNDPDAHYALAVSALSTQPPDLEKATQHLKVIEAHYRIAPVPNGHGRDWLRKPTRPPPSRRSCAGFATRNLPRGPTSPIAWRGSNSF